MVNYCCECQQLTPCRPQVVVMLQQKQVYRHSASELSFAGHPNLPPPPEAPGRPPETLCISLAY